MLKTLWIFFEWKCMLECMNSFRLFDFVLFFLKNTFMNAWNFMNFLNENAWVIFAFLILFFFFKKECIYECIKLDFFCFIIFEECIYECMWIIWMKIHAWMHEFFLLFDVVLFFLLEECIYECVKFCEFSKWKYMLECINSFYSLILFFFSWRMHLWMREILWIFWMKMHAWMHEFFLSFWYCSFFKNAWNFVNFLNESACLNTLFFFWFS